MVLSSFLPGRRQLVECLVLSIDLQDSTPFYAASDSGTSVREYLNHLISDLNIILQGHYPHDGKTTGKGQRHPMPKPLAIKFMGDGFLFIWKRSTVKQKALMTFIANMQTYVNAFKTVNNRALKGEVNKASLPKALRCGLVGGGLHSFKVKGHKTTEEWIGPAINLACRLQSYCKELKFIMHNTGVLTSKELTSLGWMKVVATEIRGHDGMLPVYVNETSFRPLSQASGKLFKKIPL